MPDRLTTEQIAALPPSAKIGYARQFNQETMPPWRDPRSLEQKSWGERMAHCRSVDQSTMPAWRDPRAGS